MELAAIYVIKEREDSKVDLVSSEYKTLITSLTFLGQQWRVQQARQDGELRRNTAKISTRETKLFDGLAGNGW